MKVYHTGTLDVKYGGPALSTYLTIKGLVNCGVETSLIMAKLHHDDQKIVGDDISILYTNCITNKKFGYIPKLKSYLTSFGKPDLYHLQGLWLYLTHATAKRAQKLQIPYVVTLRGMLYPQALEHSGLIKRLSLCLYQRRDLERAACIQATCIEEMNHYRDHGFKNPVAVIPNPIDITGLIDRPIPPKPRFRIGYLGRVHPRKRIERLIYAMDNLRNKLPDDAELLIIGGGDENYETFLKSEIKRLNLTNVRFTGFLSGKEKDKAIDSLSLLVVPSDFENFGNIVTEALVHGVPVIASKGMPWQELPENNCGWWIENNQETIDHTILEAYSLGSEKLGDMGLNGRELMRRNYSVEALGKNMKALYDWILIKGPKPDFVYEP